MDKPIDPAVKKQARLRRIAIAFGVVAALVLYLALRDGSSQTTLARERITTGKVRRDIFQDYIAVIGGVEPIQTIYLDATEGGRVDEIFLREGARLQQGEKILRLSNDSLVLQIANYETEVARATNDLRSMRVTLENQQYSNQKELLEYQYELQRLRRELANSEQLMKSGGVTQDALLLTRETLEKKTRQRELLQKKAEADTTAFTSRLTAAEEMLDSMQKNLVTNRARLDLLTIKAPAGGELASLNPELGQVISRGTRIGTINVLDAYKIRAEVDEHYIARVKLRLQASCEFGGQEYPAVVAKVYPEVRAGKFAVDLTFADKIPPEIRIGQTTRIRLELGESQRALLLPRGSFFASTGGLWVFVVNPSSQSATKRTIRLGRQNPSVYEVLEGLAEGEEVITSEYENFAHHDKVVLRPGGK
jgi:HlyD family secretion protein